MLLLRLYIWLVIVVEPVVLQKACLDKCKSMLAICLEGTLSMQIIMHELGRSVCEHRLRELKLVVASCWFAPRLTPMPAYCRPKERPLPELVVTCCTWALLEHCRGSQ